MNRSIALLSLIAALSLAFSGCSRDVSDGEDWHPDETSADAGADADETASDAETDTGAAPDIRRDSGDEDTRAAPDTSDAATDAADTGLDTVGEAGPGDTGPDASGPGLTADAVAGRPFYSLVRLTETPAITGSVQELKFDEDKTVRIGFRGAVTGKWRIFDDDSVLLYELESADGSSNQPSQFPVEAELENGWLVALEHFVGMGPDGNPYKRRFERLADADVTYDDITGKWQSEKTFTNQMGREFRIVLDAEASGTMSYGVFTGRYFGISRGEGTMITYDTGETFWFVAPPDDGSRQTPLAGEVWTDDAGNLKMYAPRGINTDGQQGPEEFEAVEMEAVESFSM